MNPSRMIDSQAANRLVDTAIERPRLLSPVSRSYSRAHVGGFLFGVVVAALLANTGKIGATAGEPVAAGAAP